MSKRVEQIVRGAREVPPHERDGYLTTACGGDTGLRTRVVEVLAADEADDTRSLNAATPADATVLSKPADALPSEQAGQAIDRYTLVHPIGEGGFGSVWLAEQREPVKRRVALRSSSWAWTRGRSSHASRPSDRPSR